MSIDPSDYVPGPWRPSEPEELLDQGLPEHRILDYCTHVSLTGEPCMPDDFAREHADADDESDRQYGGGDEGET